MKRLPENGTPDQQAKPDKWTPEHAHRLLRSLELHIFPDIGQRPIVEIMPLEVLSLLQRLEAAGKYDTAHKVYDVVNQVFSMPCVCGLSVYSTPPPNCGRASKRNSKASTVYPTLPKFSSNARYRRLHRHAASAHLASFPHVFTRPAELLMMKWEELDLDTAFGRKAVRVALCCLSG